MPVHFLPTPARGAIVTLLVAIALFGAPPNVLGQTPSGQNLRATLRQIGGPLGSEQSLSALANLASLEVSTAPLGTSTGGFTFTFDPLTRVWTRSAQSFGPSFTERSLTTGRAKVSAGFNWLHASYSAFGGQDLKNGDFRPARNVRLPPPLPAVSYSSLELNLATDTLVMFGHAGVTDNFDVGVAVPIVRVTMDASGGLFNASGTNLQPSLIPETSASGVGDLAVFAKYLLARQGEGGVAAAVEVRVPTGDKNALRGLEVTRTLTSLIWSRGGRISPHANLGYEFWSDEVPISSSGDVFARHAIKYAAGVEITATPRATVVLDFLGRHVRHGGQVAYRTFTAQGGSIDALVGIPEGIRQLSLAPGIKWNVWRSVLVTGNVLAAVSNNGLRANLTPVVGIDWAF